MRPLRNAPIIPHEACSGAYSIIVSYHSITPAGSREFMRIHHCEMTYRCRTTGRHGQHGHAAHRSTQNDEGCSTSHFLFDESLYPVSVYPIVKKGDGVKKGLAYRYRREIKVIFDPLEVSFFFLLGVVSEGRFRRSDIL